MEQTIGIFEAKTHFSEICDKVARTGEEVVVARRGRPMVRIVAVSPEPEDRVGILARMRQTEAKHGPIDTGGEDFPDVWENRRGGKTNPLEGEEPSLP